MGLVSLGAASVIVAQMVKQPKFQYPLLGLFLLGGQMNVLDVWAQRAKQAQAAAAQAYARLIQLAETRDSGQVHRVAQFIASTYNGTTFPFDLFELRAVDVAISDDMLICLDALRWGKADLYKLVPDGERRVLAVCRDWGLSRQEGD